MFYLQGIFQSFSGARHSSKYGGSCRTDVWPQREGIGPLQADHTDAW